MTPLSGSQRRWLTTYFQCRDRLSNKIILNLQTSQKIIVLLKLEEYFPSNIKFIQSLAHFQPYSIRKLGFDLWPFRIPLFWNPFHSGIWITYSWYFCCKPSIELVRETKTWHFKNRFRNECFKNESLRCKYNST